MDERGESRWRALGALLWPDRGRWLALGALVAASSVLVLAGPLVVRRLVDRAAAGADASELRGLAAVFLLVALLAQVLAVIVAWRATTAAWATTNDLRLDMTRHVLGLDHEFHRRHTPGELIQRVDGDVTSVSEFLGLVVPKALGAALTIGGMVIVLAVLDWRLAIGLVLYIGATLAIVVRGRHRAVRESSDEMGALGRLYGGIEERLVAAEDLRSNGAGAHVAWRFVEDSTDALGELGAPGAGLSHHVVVRAVGAGRRLGRGARAGGVDDLARRRHDRHDLPPLPVRPVDRAAARGPRARTRDGPEGERCHGARARPAGDLDARPRRRHRLARRPGR